MSIKRTVAAKAIDAGKRYALEQLNRLKQLDLDKDGQKDVEQLRHLVTRLGDSLREAIESTDFQRLSSGAEQMVAGAGLIADAVDRKRLGAAGRDLMATMRETGKLLKLGVGEAKKARHPTPAAQQA